MRWGDYVRAAAGAVMLAAAVWALTLVALLQGE